jgi:hypothetical protein
VQEIKRYVFYLSDELKDEPVYTRGFVVDECVVDPNDDGEATGEAYANKIREEADGSMVCDTYRFATACKVSTH